MPNSGTIGYQRLSVAVPNQSNIESEVEMPNGGTRNVWFGNQMNQSNTATDGSVALIGKLTLCNKGQPGRTHFEETSVDIKNKIRVSSIKFVQVIYKLLFVTMRLSVAVPNQSNIESEVEMPNGGTRNVWFGNQMNQSNTATD
ncbi:hypothetical protein DAPPUDRAFT_341197, partial [Daphnia pulex]